MYNIKGFVKEIKSELKDTIGYFKREIEIKRLARYANEIDSVLTRYNKKSCNETMMVKGLRKSDQETTNRKIHQEDLEKIVAQIAKPLGLNTDIIKIMGKHHDIGHTFLGHSGEWWISNILKDDGMGYFCHNAIGPRELIYTNKFYNQVIEKIKAHNPNISEKTLNKIRKSLWIIVDAINGHNGEKPQKEYNPDIHKTEEQFEQELTLCFEEEGYDRKIVPGSPEACLMRLADLISYIPSNMTDGLREGFIKELDNDYINILTKIGISEEEINNANIKGTYDKIAEKVKQIFIQDVIKNSNRSKITMSKKMLALMNELRDLSDRKIVDYVVLKEDQQTYPNGIRTLINTFENIIINNGILGKLKNAENDITINEDLKKYYGTPYERFVKYICNTNTADFEFTEKIVKGATCKAIEEELNIALNVVKTRSKYEQTQEFPNKASRIKKYIKYYEGLLEKGELINYLINEDIQTIMNNIISKKGSQDCYNIDQRMARGISAKYISTLSDFEFIELLLNAEIINDEQYKSLTRKYKDVDFKKEAYVSENWKEVKKIQTKATREYKEDTQIK